MVSLCYTDPSPTVCFETSRCSLDFSPLTLYCLKTHSKFLKRNLLILRLNIEFVVFRVIMINTNNTNENRKRNVGETEPCRLSFTGLNYYRVLDMYIYIHTC